MSNNSNIIVQKLDKFIRKYYVNQIIRGFLLAITIALLFVLVPSIFEYYGQYSTTIRSVLFYGSFLGFILVCVRFIIIPVLKLFRIGKTLSYKQAAVIVSKHFSELEDKLVNTLELFDYKGYNNISLDLLLASVEQRIADIKPIPFTLAVNFKDNVKYLKYFGIVAAVFALIFVLYPALIVEGSSRIVNHTTHFAPKAPFEFVLKNDSLNIAQGSDLEIFVEVNGDILPDRVYISYGSNNYLMKKLSNSNYSYTFRNLNNSLSFQLNTQQVFSKKYKIEILPNPLILDFLVNVNVPAYTGEPGFQIKNIGDISVPAGAVVDWFFQTKDIDSMYFSFDENQIVKLKDSTQGFQFKKKFFSSTNYSITVRNQYFSKNDILKYSVNVVPDMYPEISVTGVEDSVQTGMFYFKGLINDDYGFTSLKFHVKADSSSKEGFSDAVVIDVNRNLNTQEFYYSYDFSREGIKKGSSLEYYFEVYDNDGVNGAKASRTVKKSFRLPTEKELMEKKDQASQSIENNIVQGMQITQELQKDLMKLKENSVNNSASDWQQSQMLKQIAEKQKQLENLMKSIQDKNEEKKALNKSYSEQQESILEKQKKLEEMMENLLTDEIKELLKQIEELQENLEDPDLNEFIDDLKMSYDDLEEELDKNLELFKKFEVEEKVNDVIEKLEDLSVQQENLSEQSKDKKSDKEILQQKQEEQQQEFQDALDEYKKAMEKNQELENPMNLSDFEKQAEEIKQNFEQGKQNLQKNKGKKASENQNQNSQNLQKMAKSMSQMMQSNEAMMISQSIEELRQILENLVEFSFDQEGLMTDLKSVYSRDPKYVEYIAEQKKLTDDFELIRDSLRSLAKKTPQLGPTVNKEIASITDNLGKGLGFLEGRNTPNGRTRQQFVMTSSNNLALLLSEILSAMQQQQKSGMPGQGKSKSQQGSQPGFTKMKQQQQSLQQQLKEMLEQMKKGNEGKKGSGGKGGKNGKKKLSKMLSQQEIFSKMLRDLKQKGNLQGETMKLLDEIQKMTDENKRDIIKNRVNKQTYQRQQEIMTRLLQAENAEREREFEKRRESKEAKEQNRKESITNFPYLKLEKSFKEELEISNIKLHNFYKNKYKSYILKLNKE